MAERDPSLRSGFRLRAPAALTPANRLNFAGSDLVGNSLGKNVNAAHKVWVSVAEEARKAKRVGDRQGVP